MIKLSKRLNLLASFIKEKSKIIDIGCDHALLDIYLIKNKKSISIIATDINEQALEQAKRNIKKFDSEHQIELRLGNGLEVVNKNEIDTVIVAGMGANKIIDILVKGKIKLDNVSNLIIQSNSNIFKIRKAICELGYYIKDEGLVKDTNIIYTVIFFQKGNIDYTNKDFLLGPIISEKRCSLYFEFINKKIAKNKYLLLQIPRKYILKRKKIKQQIKLLEKELFNKLNTL